MQMQSCYRPPHYSKAVTSRESRPTTFQSRHSEDHMKSSYEKNSNEKPEMTPATCISKYQQMGLAQKRCYVASERCVTSEQFVDDGMQQRHVFGAFDGQLVDRIVVNHSRNALERLTELAQNKGTVFEYDFHVHDSPRTPETSAQKSQISTIDTALLRRKSALHR